MAEWARRARDQGGAVGGTRSGGEGLMEKLRRHSPATSQIVGFFALMTTAGVSVCLGGITAAGIAITLILSTPVFIFLSPILVPAAIILMLCIGGVITATTTGVAAISAASWLYNFMQGRKPVGSQALENARRRAIETADAAKQKALDMGGQLQSKVQQAAAPGA